MARKVEVPAVGDVVRFVPKAFGNDQDPEPIVVEWKQPTEGEKRRLASLATKSEDQFALYSQAVSKFVLSVSNYEIGNKKIETGEDLAEYGETDLFLEVGNEIFGVGGLTEEEEKNSDG